MSALKIVQNIETVSVATSSGISTSAPIPLKSGYLRISPDQNSYIDVDCDPNLSTSSLWLSAGDSILIKETVISQKIIGVQTGATTNLILPEGTFSQFNAGDCVEVIGITGVGIFTDFTRIISIDDVQHNMGGYSRKVEIDFDSSSIAGIPPWSPDYYFPPLFDPIFGHSLEGNLAYPSELRRVVKVGVKADGAPVNLHITEVQISGG